MENWRLAFPIDPVPLMVQVEHPAILFQVRRDLLDEVMPPNDSLWTIPAVLSIFRRQTDSGCWNYPSKQYTQRSSEDYDQIETYRQLGILVEKFCLNRDHPAIQLAAEYLFSRQTEEGDFRGIYGRQYSPNYSAGIAELLIKAGYQDDPRIQHAFEWLLEIRQNDGGWAIPIRTLRKKYHQFFTSQQTYQPDRSRPFSHLVTGVVLRAFAAHPVWRISPITRDACKLLVGRFFKPDAYVDRKGSEFWEHLAFPFWFTDVVSALDSLSLIGVGAENPPIQVALDWLCGRQTPAGLFEVKIVHGKDRYSPMWITLAICRIFKRYYGI